MSNLDALMIDIQITILNSLDAQKPVKQMWYRKDLTYIPGEYQEIQENGPDRYVRVFY